MTDFKELREALDADLKLPWNMGVSEEAAGVIWIGGAVEPPLSMGPNDTWIDCGGVEMARYIAAANPSTIRSLLAELDAARKDAERYRWLRDCENGKGPSAGLLEGWKDGGCGRFHWYYGDELDAVLDAAMKEQQP